MIKLVDTLAALLVLGICTGAAAIKPLYVDPACPRPGEPITFRAAPDPGQLPFGPIAVSSSGSTFTLVLPTAPNGFGAPQAVVPAEIGPLSAGTYTVQFYVRQQQPSGALGPDELVASTMFTVQDSPPVCEARHVVPLTYAMVTGLVGQPYSSLLSVQVVDAHGYPVADVGVSWQRLALTNGLPPPGPEPDLAAIVNGTTDAQGIYSFQAAANDVPGTFEYQALIDYANLNPSAYYVISNRSAPSAFPIYPVVEYFNGNLSHFFITTNPAEMAKLDGEQSGWMRTGGVFLAYGTDPTARPSDALPVCRFYGLPQAGLDSHFFSASAQECAAVMQRFGNAWLLETDDAFGILFPDIQTGTCPPDTLEVHRLYNNRPDANHRYGVAPLYLLLPPYFTDTGPWIPEGYGPDAVVMCAPA